MLILSLFLACQPTSETPDDPSSAPIEAYDPIALVDPFIATGGQGAQIANTNPGASLPWGLSHVGPDTRKESGSPGFYHCAGYWWEDDFIHGFSHNHAHGMGVPDFGGVGMMMMDGWDPAYTTPVGRKTGFSHDQEEASPGRYAVTMTNGVRVAIAATLHGAHTQVTWPEGAEPVVLFDLGPSIPDTSVKEANVTFTPGSSTLTGYQNLDGNYTGRDGGLMTWFEVELDPAPIGGGAWDEPGSPVEGATSAAGTNAGVYLRFPAGTTKVDVRVALSYVDGAGANGNRLAEMPDTDWDARATEAEDTWRSLLSRVRVRGGTDEEQTIFHTAMFHAAMMPRRQDDVDGRYRGLDRQVHVTDHPYYSDMSLWDTFRTVHPWYILAWPEVELNMARSLARMTRDGGSLPRWPIGHGYTGGMVGTPAGQVLAETWLKGLQDFDVDTAFAAAVATSRGPVPRDSRGGIQRYAAEGWQGADDGDGSVSNTLEYAWTDRSIALWGEAMGEDVADVRERSTGWENIFNTEAGFFMARCFDPHAAACTEDGFDDGWVWNTDDDHPELLWSDSFVEGNAWHYLWYVPYDVDAMIRVQHGGDRDAYLERTRTYWHDQVFQEEDDVLPDNYYWHGNEPVMHYAFLGSLAGDVDITSEASRWILSHRYAHDPAGLDGNDDAGTLSSWFLLASTGFFPVAGTTTYAVASPLWERLEIDRASAEPWVVRAPGSSEAAMYVGGVQIGGDALAAPQVEHDVLMSGDAIFSMSETPGGWP